MFGCVSYLVQNAVGFSNHGFQHFGSGFNIGVIGCERKQYVFAFPQVTSLSVGLLAHGHTRYTSVFAHGGQDVFNGGLQNGFQFRVVCIAIQHCTTQNRFAPHLTERKLRTSVSEEIGNPGIRQHAFVPMGKAVLNVVLEISREFQTSGRKGCELVALRIGLSYIRPGLLRVFLVCGSIDLGL